MGGRGRGRLTINSFRNRNHQRSGFRVCLAYGNVNRCRNGRYCAPLPPRRNSSVRKLTGHPRKGTKRGISPVSINAAPAFLRVGRTITRALISDGNLLLKKGWFLFIIFSCLTEGQFELLQLGKKMLDSKGAFCDIRS